MKVKNESEVAQSCPTLSNPMDCSLPGSSVHGIFQVRVLEWGAIGILKSRVDITLSTKVHIIKVMINVDSILKSRDITLSTMAPHSSTLAWKIPWTEEPGGLQSMGSLRVGHD